MADQVDLNKLREMRMKQLCKESERPSEMLEVGGVDSKTTAAPVLPQQMPLDRTDDSENSDAEKSDALDSNKNVVKNSSKPVETEEIENVVAVKGPVPFYGGQFPFMHGQQPLRPMGPMMFWVPPPYNQPMMCVPPMCTPGSPASSAAPIPFVSLPQHASNTSAKDQDRDVVFVKETKPLPSSTNVKTSSVKAGKSVFEKSSEEWDEDLAWLYGGDEESGAQASKKQSSPPSAKSSSQDWEKEFDRIFNKNQDKREANEDDQTDEPDEFATECAVCHLIRLPLMIRPCNHLPICCDCLSGVKETTNRCPFCRGAMDGADQAFRLPPPPAKGKMH